MLDEFDEFPERSPRKARTGTTRRAGTSGAAASASRPPPPGAREAHAAIDTFGQSLLESIGESVSSAHANGQAGTSRAGTPAHGTAGGAGRSGAFFGWEDEKTLLQEFLKQGFNTVSPELGDLDEWLDRLLAQIRALPDEATSPVELKGVREQILLVAERVCVKDWAVTRKRASPQQWEVIVHHVKLMLDGLWQAAAGLAAAEDLLKHGVDPLDEGVKAAQSKKQELEESADAVKRADGKLDLGVFSKLNLLSGDVKEIFKQGKACLSMSAKALKNVRWNPAIEQFRPVEHQSLKEQNDSVIRLLRDVVQPKEWKNLQKVSTTEMLQETRVRVEKLNKEMHGAIVSAKDSTISAVVRGGRSTARGVMAIRDATRTGWNRSHASEDTDKLAVHAAIRSVSVPLLQSAQTLIYVSQTVSQVAARAQRAHESLESALTQLKLAQIAKGSISESASRRSSVAAHQVALCEEEKKQAGQAFSEALSDVSEVVNVIRTIAKAPVMDLVERALVKHSSERRQEIREKSIVAVRRLSAISTDLLWASQALEQQMSVHADSSGKVLTMAVDVQSKAATSKQQIKQVVAQETGEWMHMHSRRGKIAKYLGGWFHARKEQFLAQNQNASEADFEEQMDALLREEWMDAFSDEHRDPQGQLFATRVWEAYHASARGERIRGETAQEILAGIREPLAHLQHKAAGGLSAVSARAGVSLAVDQTINALDFMYSATIGLFSLPVKIAGPGTLLAVGKGITNMRKIKKSAWPGEARPQAEADEALRRIAFNIGIDVSLRVLPRAARTALLVPMIGYDVISGQGARKFAKQLPGRLLVDAVLEGGYQGGLGLGRSAYGEIARPTHQTSHEVIGAHLTDVSRAAAARSELPWDEIQGGR
ncbi:hypothetical protein, partial [Burkholderia stagnalis]